MLSDERSPPMGTGKGIQQLALILLFAAISAGCASSNNAGGTSGIDQMIPGATKWGHYNGEPVTKWNPDGRTMTLLTELRYTDPHGEVWVAPVGSLPFRGIFGPLWAGRLKANIGTLRCCTM